MKKTLVVLLVMAFLVALVPAGAVYAQATKVACESDYTVQANDWLSKLADKYYGDVLAYPAIFDATNAAGGDYAKIANADRIEIGWKLCIPSKADAQKLMAAQGKQMAAGAAAPAAAGAAAPAATAAPAAAAAGGKKIALVPKATGNPYFAAVQTGAQEAAKTLGDTLIFQAPATPDVAGQIDIINGLIAQKVDAIGVSANDPDALVALGKKAADAGIKFFSWDSAVSPAGRLVTEFSSSPELIGRSQVQLLYDLMGGKGDFAILSATSTATNQNEWIKWMKEELKDPKYKDMNLVATVYGDDLPEKSTTEAQGLFKSYPNLKGIISPTTVGVAATAKAITDANLCGKVALTGLGLPSLMREYIKSGCVTAFGLWNPVDQGYLSTYIGDALAKGAITGKVGDAFKGGRMGDYKVEADPSGTGTAVIQGPPFKFDKTNIDSPAAGF
jgi:rhamnose transport system substrate-binding protein